MKRLREELLTLIFPTERGLAFGPLGGASAARKTSAQLAPPRLA
jgi:hypothetical protein